MEIDEGDLSGTWTNAGSQAVNDISIRCVTVRQLHEATQTHSTSQFRIDGNEFKEIVIVANLCFLERGPTFTDFGLDDGTGRIKARQWRRNSNSHDDMLEVRDFPYLRIIGDLEQFKGKKTIKVIDIRKVSSPYEPYYHILHTICDSLMYERGPPSSQGENQDDTRTDEPDILDHDAIASPPSLASVVHPTPETARSDAHVDLMLLSANGKGKAYKGKTPMPAKTLPSTSMASPISPTHHWRAEDVGIPEYSGVALRDDRGASIRPYKDTAIAVPSGSSPPRSSTPTRQRTRRFTLNDPYSKLTTLQRDVLLCITTMAAQNPTPHVYPTTDLDNSEHDAGWKGVHVSVIIQSVTNQHPELDLGLPEFLDCFEGLLEEGYICNPVDDEHYSCT